MQRNSVSRLLVRLLGSVLLLSGMFQACATDSYDGVSLTIPAVTIGGATYNGVVATVAGIVSGPAGSGPAGSIDSYDPATNRLTIPAVTYGARTYYNVVANVETLRSIHDVSGADSYSAGSLTIPAVQVGTTLYTDVVLAVTPTSVVSVAGNMPTAAFDRYEPAQGELFIPAVQVGATVYTNVTIAAAPGEVRSLGGSGGTGCPPVAGATTLSLSTGSPFYSFLLQTPANASNVSYSSYSFDFNLQSALAPVATVNVTDGRNPDVSIADLGVVCGLGGISTFPAKSQFASYGTLNLQLGHGYFVEAPNGSYARMVVTHVYDYTGVDIELEYPSVICPASGVSITYSAGNQTYDGVSITGVVSNGGQIDNNGTLGGSGFGSTPFFGCNAVATVRAWGGGGGGGGNYDLVGGAGGGGGGGGGYGAESIVLTPGQYYLATAGAGGDGGNGLDGVNGLPSVFSTFSATDSAIIGTPLFESTGGQGGKVPLSHTAPGVGGAGGGSSASGTVSSGQPGTNGITVAASPCSPGATFGIGPGGAGGDSGGIGGRGGNGGCTPGVAGAPGGGGAGDSEYGGATNGAYGWVVISY